MQQALERLSKTLDAYRQKSLSRGLATIELVSAFKVVSRTLIDPDQLQAAVAKYIESVLIKLDESGATQDQAFEELSRVYAAAHEGDPEILLRMQAHD